MENLQQLSAGGAECQDGHRWVMHLDMDAFFAAVEQRDNPAYRGRPVVVGARPGTRGVVATCSYEARAYGVRSAMPISEAYRRCPQACFVQPDAAKYSEASAKVFAALREISPVVEPVSIDEAYVDISGLGRLFGDVRRIGAMTREKIGARVGLGCSVGIGPNRLIAKLASDWRKPNGLVIVAQESVQAFLDPMPVSALRGVGRRSLDVMQRLGIRRVAELRDYSLDQLHAFFGEAGGDHLYRQARGIASDRVGLERVRKSISRETTFAADVQDRRQLRNALRRLASELGERVRREGLRGRSVTLKIRFSGFETHTRRCRVPSPLDADIEIFRHAWTLYEQGGYTGRAVRLLGVGLSDWSADEPTGDLFGEDPTRRRQQRLYRTLDQVKARFGKRIITLGLERE